MGPLQLDPPVRGRFPFIPLRCWLFICLPLNYSSNPEVKWHILQGCKRESLGVGAGVFPCGSFRVREGWVYIDIPPWKIHTVLCINIYVAYLTGRGATLREARLYRRVARAR